MCTTIIDSKAALMYDSNKDQWSSLPALPYTYFSLVTVPDRKQGRIQDFLRGGSEHGGVSLKQGVWGHSPPEAIGFFVITTPKSCLL